jgi:hypothetical protein
MNPAMRLIENEKKSVEKSVKTAKIISLLLILLVFAEVVFIRQTIHKKLAPKNVATMVVDGVYGQIPEINRQLLLSAEQNAPILASQFVEYTIDTIRNLEPMTYNSVMVLTDQLMSEIKTKGVPEFQKLLLDIYSDVALNREKLSNQQFAEEAIKNLLDAWQLEFQKQLDSGLNLAVDHFGNEMSILLTTPDQQMTKKQAAEKQLLACAHILIDRLAADHESGLTELK